MDTNFGVAVRGRAVGDLLTRQFGAHLSDCSERAYVVAMRLLSDREAAHDACQEAAKRAWAARDRYDRKQPFYPWFYRVLKNVCLDRLRKRKRHLDAQPRLRDVLPQPIEDAESSFARTRREAAVLRAIQRMSPDVRELIELRHFQDLSYQEIADVLDCPVGTVMSRLYRARKTLRRQLLTDPNFKEADRPLERRTGLREGCNERP